ncbi:MAG TPA: hypothetical protein VK034_17820 [Enhygromyxa sp.]|nr:hypothetical protein [Enhygromyxa sp.]
MSRSKACLLTLALTCGCVARARPEQCQAMVEHIIALSRAAHQGRAAEIAAEVASERRQAVLDRCLTDGTVAEVECVLAADSLEAIQRCAP